MTVPVCRSFGPVRDERQGSATLCVLVLITCRTTAAAVGVALALASMTTSGNGNDSGTGRALALTVIQINTFAVLKFQVVYPTNPCCFIRLTHVVLSD